MLDHIDPVVALVLSGVLTLIWLYLVITDRS